MQKPRILVFFSGILAFLIFLHFMGAFLLSKPQFPELKRFWTHQSPNVDFYPTAKQLEKWALQQITKDKQVVIIGGSSVMLGVGQPVDQTISANLQNILGSKFVVLNLAVKGGGTFGQGLYIANALKKRGYRVIYISDVFINYVPPYENNWPYEVTYWQSYYSNQLDPTSLVDSEMAGKPMSRIRFLSFMNSYINFYEILNYITYNYFPLVQTKILGDSSFKPLKSYPDDEPATPYSKRYLNKDFEKAQLEMVTGNARVQTDANSLSQAAIRLKIGFARNPSPRIILVSCNYNPRYVNQLSSKDKSNYEKNISNQLIEFHRNNLDAESYCNNFTDREYSDGTHLSIEGASKVAIQLAERILSK